MIDMTGKTYGKLTVIEKDHQDGRGEWYWKCKCECGNEKVVSGYKLRSGNTSSCGCLQTALRQHGTHRTHGMTNTRIYNIWSNMKARCTNPKCYEYHAYGGKGIRVCDDWLRFENFYSWATSHGYADGLTIDRVDVNGNYCPNNCRWVSQKEQALNRTDNHLVTAFGKTKTIKEWSVESGINYDTIERRLNAYHWTPDRAVSEPVHYRGRKKR